MRCCGIDISKEKSNICIINNNEIELESEIQHTREEFDKFEKHLTKETIIGMECTGNYSKTLYFFLKKKGYTVYYIDNVQMHNFAKLHYLHVKNDKVDAKLIAKYLQSNLKKIIPGKMDGMKDLCRIYHRSRTHLTRYKRSFINQLSIFFPELEKIAYLKKAKAVPYLLLKYSTPKEIANASTEEIYKTLVETLDKESYFNMEFAEKIKEAAKKSIGISDYPTGCFKYTIEHMLFYQKMIDKILKDLKDSIIETPYVHLLEKQGYGITSLAIIIGETGDIRRFTNHKKFVKYCGFDISEKQSGQNSSKHCFITKQGNKYLRSMFFNLVLQKIKKGQEHHEFYHRLKNKGKHTHKCMTATARKIAIRTYYDMMKCHA